VWKVIAQSYICKVHCDYYQFLEVSFNATTLWPDIYVDNYKIHMPYMKSQGMSDIMKV